MTFKNSFSFEINEVAKGLFVHFGEQEDSNAKNNGDIANIGFIVGSQSIAVIDTGGTPEIGMKLLKKIKETSSQIQSLFESKRFFKIVGIKINSNFYKKKIWYQPIIVQNEIGILGIIKNIKTNKLFS